MPLTRTQARLGYLALAAADTYLATRQHTAARAARFVTKPLLMPTLAASTHLATPGRGDVLLRGTQAAQVLSWKGDVALLGRGKRPFLAGVGMFFLAHVGYIAAFAGSRERGALLQDGGPRAAAAVWVATAPAMAYGAGRKDPTMRVPIAGYASILAAMFATSTTLSRALPARARRRIVAGTALFLASDTLLGVQAFFRDEPAPALEGAVMATYTAGQFLIAEGVVAAG